MPPKAPAKLLSVHTFAEGVRVVSIAATVDTVFGLDNEGQIHQWDDALAAWVVPQPKPKDQGGEG